MVGVAALVQRLAEHVPAQGHAAAHQDARQLAELDVRQALPAEGEAAPVADGDVAPPARAALQAYSRQIKCTWRHGKIYLFCIWIIKV